MLYICFAKNMYFISERSLVAMIFTTLPMSLVDSRPIRRDVDDK